MLVQSCHRNDGSYLFEEDGILVALLDRAETLRKQLHHLLELFDLPALFVLPTLDRITQTAETSLHTSEISLYTAETNLQDVGSGCEILVAIIAGRGLVGRRRKRWG